MTTITVANYSRKHGDIETVIITDEEMDKKIKDHIYVTQNWQSWSLAQSTVSRWTKTMRRLLKSNQHRLILETRENRIKYLKEYVNVTPKEMDWTIYILRCKAPTSRKAWDERSES